MKAIFYKLINIDPPSDSWWKKEVEITNFEQFWNECVQINWSEQHHRYCYLDDIRETDDKSLVEKCQKFIRDNNYNNHLALIERLYLMGKIVMEEGVRVCLQ